MPNLIDRDYILSALGVFNDTANDDWDYLAGIDTAREIVHNAPTIDAVPVVRGHWMPYYRDILQCSSCKMTTSVPYMGGHYKYDYCPHCGTKMDEVSE